LGVKSINCMSSYLPARSEMMWTIYEIIHVILRHSTCSHRASGAWSRTLNIRHIVRSCCYVVPVALLNKELRRQYCDNSYVNCGCRWKWRKIIAVNFS